MIEIGIYQAYALGIITPILIWSIYEILMKKTIKKILERNND